jgi:hypothetical protein
MSELPAEATALFRVQPEGFVAERDALVKRLRAEGRDDDAARIKALRKPTAVTWALNQLSARDADGLDALFEAGRQLRAAQQAALSGGRGNDLVEAAAARRGAVGRLTSVAVSTLEDAGHRGSTQADAIGAALDTAATDPAVGARLAAGTLERVPTAAADLGFGDLPAMTAVPGGRKDEAAATQRVDRARLRRELEAARKSARTRRATADRLAAQLTDLRERLDALTVEHAEAETAALEAETEAERAARSLEDDG